MWQYTGYLFWGLVYTVTLYRVYTHVFKLEKGERQASTKHDGSLMADLGSIESAVYDRDDSM